MQRFLLPKNEPNNAHTTHLTRTHLSLTHTHIHISTSKHKSSPPIPTNQFLSPSQVGSQDLNLDLSASLNSLYTTLSSTPSKPSSRPSSNPSLLSIKSFVRKFGLTVLPLPSSPPLKPPRGIVNPGNTCYVNTVLICLAAIPGFVSNTGEYGDADFAMVIRRLSNDGWGRVGVENVYWKLGVKDMRSMGDAVECFVKFIGLGGGGLGGETRGTERSAHSGEVGEQLSPTRGYERL